MSRLKPGMVVMVYRRFATRQSPIGRAELLQRVSGGLLPRGGQLEHWRVRYLDSPGADFSENRPRPQSVTVRTDEPDLRPNTESPPRDYGPSVQS